MKPMLATGVDVSEIRFPTFASAKLDGIRGLVIDGKLLSRSLKPIPNKHISELYSRPELTGYDGELVVGSPTAPDVCRVTGGACGREKWSPVAPDVKFYVFDNFAASGDFTARLATLQAFPGVLVLEQRLVTNEAELLAFEAEILDAGYEGLILRDPSGAYKFGRSTALERGMLKLKRFVDAEAEIISVVEQMENANVKVTNELGRGQRSTEKAGMRPKGTAGALLVRDLTTGVEFSVGTANDADSAFFWKRRNCVAGKIIKYKSFPIGVKDKPRFPIYLGPREPWDMDARAGVQS